MITAFIEIALICSLAMEVRINIFTILNFFNQNIGLPFYSDIIFYFNKALHKNLAHFLLN